LSQHYCHLSESDALTWSWSLQRRIHNDYSDFSDIYESYMAVWRYGYVWYAWCVP